MLDAGGDQMVSLSSGSHSGANEGHIVGLRSAGGKNDLLFLYLQGACDLLPGLPDVPFRLHALHMSGGGIAVIGGHGLHHHVPDTVKDPGRG